MAEVITCTRCCPGLAGVPHEYQYGHCVDEMGRVTTEFKQRAVRATFEGDYLPAHDEVFDLATTVGETLDSLHSYITSVRDAQQADLAITELLARITKEEAHDLHH